MLTLPLTLMALAALVWPSVASARRLRALYSGPARRVPAPRHLVALVGVGCVAGGWLAAGLGGAIAAGLLAVTVGHQIRHRKQVAARLAATEGLAEALRALVAELAAGAHPADAAESAARDAHPSAARCLTEVASAVRLGGEVDAAFGQSESNAAVSRAWRLATHHGVPLADLLNAVRDDLDHQSRFARQVLARMAGPRASAMTLAALPLLGIVLGQVMGADPVVVLTGTVTGQVLLAVGAGLVCAGLLWTNRITGRVVAK